MAEVRYRMSGLSKLDRLELQADPAFSFEEVRLPSGSHGEVVTIVAILGLAGISTLAAFLLRKHRGESFEDAIEELGADGSIKRRVVRWRKEATDPPEASIIKQIRGE